MAKLSVQFGVPARAARLRKQPPFHLDQFHAESESPQSGWRQILTVLKPGSQFAASEPVRFRRGIQARRVPIPDIATDRLGDQGSCPLPVRPDTSVKARGYGDPHRVPQE